MDNLVKKRIIPYVSYGLSTIVFLYACFSIYKIITTSAPDFEVYYGATKEFLNGINPYTGSVLYTGFGYPPFTATVFLPFLLFPTHIAQGIFIILSVLSIPCIVLLLLRTFKGNHIGLHELLICSSLFFLLFPTRFTLGMGQSNLITLLLVSGSLFAWVRGKTVTSSLLFGLSLCYKPHLVLILPFILLTGEWIFVLRSLGVVMGAGIVSTVLFGWERYIQYYHDMVLTLLPYTGRGIYYNQGFAGFFARILPQNQASVATFLSSVFLYFGSLITALKTHAKLPAVISLGLCVMVLVEPLSWQHHIVFLLPAGISLWAAIRTSKISGIVLACSILLVGYNIRQPEYLQSMGMAPIILSHGFFGTMVISGLMLLSLRKPQI